MEEKKLTTPLKAIRAFCLDCSGTSNEVKTCTNENCPLFAFRFGKNPHTTRSFTDEQRQAAAERLKKAREAKQSNG